MTTLAKCGAGFGGIAASRCVYQVEDQLLAYVTRLLVLAKLEVPPLGASPAGLGSAEMPPSNLNLTPYFRETLEGSLSAVSTPILQVNIH